MYLQICKSVLITSPTGFDVAFTNVEDTLKQHQDKVVSTLFQRWFKVEHQRCINFVQRWKSDVVFCFIFNIGAMLFQRWSKTLKQRWPNFEMLTGKFEYALMRGSIPLDRLAKLRDNPGLCKLRELALNRHNTQQMLSSKWQSREGC